MTVAGRIAVVGWGSLIWDLDDLADHIDRGQGVDGWALGAGPRLPVEFCRVARKRRDALTLAIDHAHGEPCATAFAISRRSELEAAALDLARREHAPEERIGRWSAAGHAHGASGAVIDAIAAWAKTAGLDGVVWTDLQSNFAERTGAAFSIPAAIAHLRNLPETSLREAATYIARAPRETDTPLRRELSGLDWWRRRMARFESGDD